MKKRNKTYLSLFIAAIFLIILILVIFIKSNDITGFASLGTTNNVDETDDFEERFHEVVLEALYSKKYCNDGRNSPEQELRNGLDCAETLYPFIKIKHSEEYESLDQITLAARVEKFIREKIPETNDEKIGFVFVDSNQKLIEILYFKNGNLIV